jgi:hypothetical protein
MLVMSACKVYTDVMPDWAQVETPPFPLMSAGVVNPVLTAHDVTDISAAFVADPFLFHENGMWHLFFEVMNVKTSQGDIGHATSADGISWKYDRIVLDETIHLSYPFVFKYNEKYYMIPETNKFKEIRLYESANFPYDWSHVATLVTGKAFVDASILWFNGVWWIFASDTGNSNLYLYYSDNLLTGWTEHPKSPVIIGDASSARPAGRPFIYNKDHIIRLGQKSDLSYGEQVRAFEVDVLTKLDYAERETSNSPLFTAGGSGWNAIGMHHFDPWWTGNKWICSTDGRTGDIWSIWIFYAANPSSPNGTISGPVGNVTINAGETVTFTGTGSDPDGNLPLSYRWNFGAGSGVSDYLVKDPGVVRFVVPGTYTVTFTVTDSLGLVDPIPATVVVTVKSRLSVILMPVKILAERLLLLLKRTASQKRP